MLAKNDNIMTFMIFFMYSLSFFQGELENSMKF